ncbi:flagellar basal-body rod protein FlgG [Bartonella bacilliformis str. Heidi Mejia]|nr:flagellar basal-body rod protein FlgG [Bartonella bacilliformis str. Heidi Mejia]KEG16144.1 flagellar basal-body rod protein FlgG [Bartonella bacilliformis Cond044]KEG18133.1 flagellar basal-body rod protein FlgG [Bartonella bacilliformis Hosp800-02]KEG21761.1 flagellar basal-body rod protein FlgG [Bartonella bacilliformis VAB9028]KEG23136.1 flagellar basal-body rod protein FlgG [Bartonella bacilliformis CAR600-02]
MVMRSLSIAATGMAAQQTNLDVIANNLANINTTGYKRARAEFADLMYVTDRAVGVPNMMNQAIVPEGVMVGMGVRTAAVRTVNTQGAFVQTGNALDLAINGNGWFEIQDPNGNVFYTRSGAFNLSETGQIVTLDGNVVQPAITIPIGSKSITVSPDGTVFYKPAEEADPVEAGRLNLVNFVNEVGLEPVGDNLFRETPASGAPVPGNPKEDGYGSIMQATLEASNVDPVKEITELITAQRSYEMNSKVIQASDEMAAVVSKNLR